MKIILIGSVPPPYHGSTIYFRSLLESRLHDVHTVYHLDTSDHRTIDNITKLDPVNVYLAVKNVFQLIFMLGARRPDIVYVPLAQKFLPYIRDGLFILCAKFFSRAKIVVHLHGGDYFRKEFYEKSGKFAAWFVRKTLSYAHTAIVLGNSLRCIFEDLVDRIEVVPNGIEDPVARRNGSDTGRQSEKFVIGYLGNFFESKGILDVLEASREVISRHPHVTFRFAGAWTDQEPDTKKAAYRLIEEYGLKENVEFAGMLRGGEKERFLTDMSIFVFPSRYEGQPLVILEAMASGLPVVSTKGVGAIDEMVIDGVTGILVDKQSPEQIARALVHLIEHPDVCMTMGKAGRKRFKESFLMDKNIGKMIGVFEKVYGES